MGRFFLNFQALYEYLRVPFMEMFLEYDTRKNKAYF